MGQAFTAKAHCRFKRSLEPATALSIAMSFNTTTCISLLGVKTARSGDAWTNGSSINDCTGDVKAKGQPSSKAAKTVAKKRHGRTCSMKA